MTNQNQSEVEMWWADLDECPEEDDISLGTILRKHPRQGPLKWQESLFPVVRKSDYDKLKEENQRLNKLLQVTELKSRVELFETILGMGDLHYPWSKARYEFERELLNSSETPISSK